MAKKREEYGGSVYDQQYFSDDELRRAAEIRSAAEAGETSWKDAHDFVENIRSGYGYSGGDDGDSYNRILTDNVNVGTSVKPSYLSPYQSQLDALYQQISNRPAFSYDYTQDPLYQQYEESYMRNGKRAAADTLAQVSARTGGLASSYAGTASQQAYGNYMSALADKIPELRQAAYNMYVDEGNQLMDRYNLLRGMENDAYGQYQDALGQWNTDRTYNYGVGRDAIADERYADETAYERNIKRAQTLAEKANDYSGYKALGYTDDEIARMQAANQLVTTSGGGPYRGTSGGTTEMDYDGLFEAAKASGNPRSWLAQKANYTQYGFTSSSGLYNDYQEWEKEQSSKTVEGGWNKSEPFKNPLALGGRNPSAGKTGGTANNPGIPQRYIDEINRDAEGGMSVANLANKLERWVSNGIITEAQRDWLAASFGY